MDAVDAWVAGLATQFSMEDVERMTRFVGMAPIWATLTPIVVSLILQKLCEKSKTEEDTCRDSS